MKPFWTSMLVICALAGGGGYYWWKTQTGAKTTEAAAGKSAKGEGKGEGKGGGRRGSGGPVSVRTVTVGRQPMPFIIDVVGAVESENSIAVRPQISGVLQSVMFKEGDYVKQGQVLFRIDPRPAQAALDQARAAVARDQAQLAQAQAQEARLRPLMEKDYVTRQEYDVAATAVKSLEATANANKAALEQAQIQMAYTQISAPLSGRTGSLNVKAGNLVTAGTVGAALVVINSTQPILVAMSVPQRLLEEVRNNWRNPDFKVQVSTNPGTPPVAEGPLVFIDNSVSTQTGTIVLKARVKNEKEQLWPGQFISARMIVRVDKEAVVLPEAAVQPGQDSPFVYLVRDGKAIAQDVEVARQVGNLVVISKGLSGGEQVIANVPPTLAPGATVQVQTGDANGDKGGARKGGGKGAKAEQAKE